MDDISPFAPIRMRDLNDEDKPREKALDHGIRALTDAELLAIVFGGGLPGVSVIDMARTILRDCGNRLDTLARMSMQELMKKYRGVGPAKAVSLAAAFELGRRNREQAAARRDFKVRGSSDIDEVMRPLLEGIEHEEFWVLMLSRSLTLKEKRCISQGGTAATVVDVKLLLKRAVDCLADAIALVHNHPSGTLQPSPQDDALTAKIKQGASLLDIRVIDHVIIGRSGYYSYADNAHL